MSSSTASSDENGATENQYCIFLHISEGVGLQRSRSGAVQHDQILMHAQFNGVKFEIEGHSTEAATIFNSNCVWETTFDDLKKLKTVNRPVGISCFLDKRDNNNPDMKLIGKLLLPIRSVTTVNSLIDFQPKMLWHKLGALSAEWRSYKPEIYLFIIITKKSLLGDNNFSALVRKKPMPSRSSRSSCETSGMLQSQCNVYVQLIEQVGLIQVGNNPDVDCDIYVVVLTLKRIKDLAGLFESEQPENSSGKFAFQYELFGNVTHEEINIDESDDYALNQKIAIKFKTSLASLRLYFQRIFYIPIIIYFNGHAIATYRFDYSKFLPEIKLDEHAKTWYKNGVFFFDGLHRILSPRVHRPWVEFSIGIELLESYSRRVSKEIVPLRDTFVPYKVDEGAAGDGTTASGGTIASDPFSAKALNAIRSGAMTSFIEERAYQNRTFETTTACVDTNDLCSYEDACSGTDELIRTRTIAINTEKVEKSPPKNVETVTVEMIKELESWKSQQMQEFAVKLEQKEIAHLRNIEREWLKKETDFQDTLKAKASECALLKNELDATKTELEACRAERVFVEKKENERIFAQKLKQLELDVQNWRVKLEQQKRATKAEKDIRESEQRERAKLEQDNLVLKRNNTMLEQKLISLGKTHFSAGQLKEMLTDLRHQTERFAEVEKQRNAYKEKLVTTQRELQQLQLSMLKEQELKLLRNAKDTVGSLDLNEVLEGEKPPTLSSRTRPKRIEPKSESKRIKERILQQAESGSSYDEDLSSSTQ